ILPQQAWVLGRIILPSARPQVVLLRTDEIAREATVQQWLSTNVSVIRLFPRHEDSVALKEPSLHLAEVLTIQNEELRLHDHWHASLSEYGESKKPKAKPRPRRSIRTSNIEKIENYLIEYLTRRRDIALTAFHDDKVMDPFPCPLQKEICEGTKLN